MHTSPRQQQQPPVLCEGVVEQKADSWAGLAASSSSQYPRPPAAPRMGEPGRGVVTIRAGDNPSRRFHYHGEGLGPSAVVVHLHIRQ